MLELLAEVVYLVSDLAEPVDVIHQPTVNDGLQSRGERQAGTNDQLGRSRIARPLTLGRCPRAWSRGPCTRNQAKDALSPAGGALAVLVSRERGRPRRACVRLGADGSRQQSWHGA